MNGRYPNMSANDEERKKFLREASGYDDLRDELGRMQLENLRYLKGQVADWYVALAAVCFAIGGISISLVRYEIKHPAFFWWGSVLLIANGVFIFFFRKYDLDREFSEIPNLKQNEADLWTMSKIAREHADGNKSRKEEFKVVVERFSSDYDKRSQPFNWLEWVKFAVLACMVEIVFGMFLFPILMLASQLPNQLHIRFKTYTWIIVILLAAYVLYIFAQAKRAIQQKRKANAADRQIKVEVEGKT